MSPTPDFSSNANLYSTMEQHAPIVDGVDYRTFIFDNNEKFDFAHQLKKKKEEQLTDPFLRNFLGREEDKKKMARNTSPTSSGMISKFHLRNKS